LREGVASWRLVWDFLGGEGQDVGSEVGGVNRVNGNDIRGGVERRWGLAFRGGVVWRLSLDSCDAMVFGGDG
jgi:hypothetical protein